MLRGRSNGSRRRASFLSSAFGALKGTVTIKPGTDLTDPIDTDMEC